MPDNSEVSSGSAAGSGSGHGRRQSHRRCIFCAEPADSLEDVIPQWLLATLSDDGRQEGEFLFERQGEKRKPWRGSPLKVRRVCSGCNNGWMSRLEGEAKPILTPMLWARSAELKAEQQLTVAEWTLKTAITFDATNARPFFSVEERTGLYLARSAVIAGPPPSFLHVWLARYNGDYSSRSYGTKLRGFARPEESDAPLRVDGHVWTFTAAAFAAQALTTRVPHVFAHRRAEFADAEQEWSTATVQIWPPRSRLAGWPPLHPIGDAAFERFANRWPRLPAVPRQHSGAD